MKAQVNLVFDDARSTVYSIAYPIMQTLGIVGTVPVISSLIDSGANYMTLANLTELQNAGWAIVNHSKSHLHMGDENDATVLDEYITCRDYLQTNGFTEGKEMLIFPAGSYDNGTIELLRGQGAIYLSGRATTKGVIAGSKFETPRVPMDNTEYADFAGYIDSIITKKLYMHLYYHHFTETTTGSSTSISTFTNSMNYLKTLIRAGLIEAPNMIDYYDEYILKSRSRINGVINSN